MTQPPPPESRGRPAAGDSPDGPALDETIRAAARGDEAAWRRLIAAYTRRVYGLLWRQCGDGDLAEELTQATFVKVAGALGSGTDATSGGATSGGGYVEQGHFESWLFRIALNNLRDEMRRRGRQAKVVDMSPAALSSSTGSAWGAAQDELARRAASHNDPAAISSRREAVEQVRAAVARLSDPEQRVLHLRHTAGLSFAQIAETLNEPIGTVLARSHRALGKLRRKLDTEQGPD